MDLHNSLVVSVNFHIFTVEVQTIISANHVGLVLFKFCHYWIAYYCLPQATELRVETCQNLQDGIPRVIIL